MNGGHIRLDHILKTPVSCSFVGLSSGREMMIETNIQKYASDRKFTSNGLFPNT